MKKVTYLFIAIITAVSFSSCEKEDEEDISPNNSSNNSSSINPTPTDDEYEVFIWSYDQSLDIIANDGITASDIDYITILTQPTIGTIELGKEYVIGCGHCGDFTGNASYECTGWWFGEPLYDSFEYKVVLTDGTSYTANVNITLLMPE